MDYFSQFVILLESHSSHGKENEQKLYTLKLPQCFPDCLYLEDEKRELRSRLATEFKTALLVQISLPEKYEDDDWDEDEYFDGELSQRDAFETEYYFLLRDYFTKGLKDYYVSAINEGLWSAPPEIVYSVALETLSILTSIDEDKILSVSGLWRRKFRVDIGR